MVTASPARLMTTEEFEQFRGAPDKRYELVDGRVVEMSPAAPPHGWATWYAGFLLGQYVIPRSLGRIYAAETGFVIRRGPDTVRAPDIAFIASDRLPGEEISGFGPVIPDFIVEVVSLGDTANEVESRMSAWLQAGVKVGWAVYPALRMVAIHRSPSQVDKRLGEEDVDAEPAIPGFRCKASDLFPPSPRP